ncbi:hypothetical protein EDD11_001420 [Mortierella claussenii]|nr:hypothetical protein EDD11_001420 [Mortierella claussenii]
MGLKHLPLVQTLALKDVAQLRILLNVQPSYYKEDVTIAALVRDIANSSYSSTLLQDLKTGNDLQNRDFKWYVLENLDHGASYELRVSYPATSPADFEIMVWTLSEAQDHCAQDVRLDKLFDKHIMIARIKATYTGVSYRSNGVSGPEVRPIPFNLVLERLYFMIPYQALKLAAAIAGVVMVGLGYMVPKIHRALLNAASRGILKDDMTQRKTE